MNNENRRHLKDIEIDFIEYIANLRKVDKNEIKEQYYRILNEFQCHTTDYKKYMNDIFKIEKILYDYSSPEQQIAAYKHHDIMLLLRYLSYSYSQEISKQEIGINSENNDSTWLKLQRRRIYKLIKGRKKLKVIDGNTILEKETLHDQDLTVRNWELGLAFQHSKIATYLNSFIDDVPIIVDYGSGLGYISYEICKLHPNAKVHLVDIDNKVLSFTEYRFKKQDYDVCKIPISSVDEYYPELPAHNICIATEVVEHLEDPLKFLRNIRNSLLDNGVVFGNFDDHAEEEQHISCDLSDFRKEINSIYVNKNEMTWQKTT